MRIIRKIVVLDFYLSQQQPQCAGHAPGAQLSPHSQLQQAVLAFAGSDFVAVLPAKLVAVSVNKIPEMRTKSFFMFVFLKKCCLKK
jgi:hypothetical protein